MFKNSVFKVSVSTEKWVRAAAVRAVRTMAQTAAGVMGTGAVTIGAVDWKLVSGAAALAGVLSVLTSLAGIPEVADAKEETL